MTIRSVGSRASVCTGWRLSHSDGGCTGGGRREQSYSVRPEAGRQACAGRDRVGDRGSAGGPRGAARNRTPATSPLPVTSNSCPGRPTSSAASPRSPILRSRCGRQVMWVRAALLRHGSPPDGQREHRRLEQPAHRKPGLDGTSGKLHYEEDYYATLTLAFSKASFATTYTAYTSPNAMFGTTQEIAFKISPTYRYGPYVLLAQELSGGADAGPNEGTYLELGLAGPSWGLRAGKFSVAVPVKLGLSLNDYYEHPITGEDHAFGFFDIGVLVTIPISKVSSLVRKLEFPYRRRHPLVRRHDEAISTTTSRR